MYITNEQLDKMLREELLDLCKSQRNRLNKLEHNIKKFKITHIHRAEAHPEATDRKLRGE